MQGEGARLERVSQPESPVGSVGVGSRYSTSGLVWRVREDSAMAAVDLGLVSRLRSVVSQSESPAGKVGVGSRYSASGLVWRMREDSVMAAVEPGLFSGFRPMASPDPPLS
jgi:hypothetical protein